MSPEDEASPRAGGAAAAPSGFFKAEEHQSQMMMELDAVNQTVRLFARLEGGRRMRALKYALELLQESP